MKNIFKLLTAFVFILFTLSLNAQFTIVRPDQNIDGFSAENWTDCQHDLGYGYRMIDDSYNNTEVSVAIWIYTSIDLTSSFTVDFNVRFDSNSNQPADGVAFVLQNEDPNFVGRGGAYMGFGRSNNSNPATLGVEFDVFENDMDDRFDDNIADDHAALYFNSDLSNSITPLAPLGNGNVVDGNWHRVRVIWDPCELDFDVFFDGVNVVHYQGDIVNQVFAGNPTVQWGFTAAKWDESCDIDLCITQIITDSNCDAQTDLTACAAEGDFGFVALQCQARYEWVFPAGSTAMEIASPFHSVVTNMSEGVYQVTIMYPGGCEEVLEFEVVEDCCEASVPECSTPENPRCEQSPFTDILIWDAVPGAVSYRLFITSGPNISCDCSGPSLSQAYNLVNNSMPVPGGFGGCFTWTVQALCRDGSFSNPTISQCYTGRCDSTGGDGDNPGIGCNLHAPNRSNLYPNPSNGIVNVALDLEQAGTVALEVMDLAGRVLQTFPSEQLAEGTHLKTLSINNALNNGVYLVRVTYGDGSMMVHEVVLQK